MIRTQTPSYGLKKKIIEIRSKSWKLENLRFVFSLQLKQLHQMRILVVHPFLVFTLLLKNLNENDKYKKIVNPKPKWLDQVHLIEK